MNSNKFQVTGTPEYDRHFWNAMRGAKESVSSLESGRNSVTGAYALPNSTRSSRPKSASTKVGQPNRVEGRRTRGPAGEKQPGEIIHEHIDA